MLWNNEGDQRFGGIGMSKEIVLRYVTMPMAIQVFTKDIELFSVSRVGMVYADLLESIIEEMKKDFRKMKAEMITKHSLDVRYLEKNGETVKYRVNKEVLETTSGELRDYTEMLMREYLTSDAAIYFERKERIWGDFD